tara:strand:- start:492 stop:638 length:147 start_codon:yes stop_codon:yes gene_type:complete
MKFELTTYILFAVFLTILMIITMHTIYKLEKNKIRIRERNEENNEEKK